MPRGVPRSGFRMTNKRKAVSKVLTKDIIEQHTPVVILQNETDTEIAARLDERFDILQTMASAAISGNIRSVIVSGAPGVGKSYGIQKLLTEHDPNGETFTIVRGFTRPTGLFKLLYQHRHKGNVIVFDDADSAFGDDIGLNLLKAVCDTTDQRVVSWLAETNLIDEESAERIPRTFVFNGSVVFLTNLDFETLIARGHKLAPHLEALMSRSHYLDLSLKTRRDYLIRLRSVIKAGLLSSLNETQHKEVVDFLEENYAKMRELSLRAAIKLASLCKSSPKWKTIAKVTMLK